MSCKTCRTPKFRGDPCTNPDCPRVNRVTVRIKSRTLPITTNVKHGFHAPNQTAGVTGYDAPIRNARWIAAR